MCCSGEAFEHDADHCETDKGGDGRGIAFEITHEAPVAADPRERSFDNLSFG